MQKKILSAALIVVRPLGARWFMQKINQGVRAISSFTHFLQYGIEWGRQPTPEWYDHFLDQHHFWKKTGNSLPWERGIFSLLAVKQGAKVLELCCGDGFNSHHFYANRAGSILALDFDPKAIQSAKRNFNQSHVAYIVGDIRKDIPAGEFDNVIWDAAIEHFTESEIAQIMVEIKKRLGISGVLSGYTLVERPGGKSHHEHEYEFHSKEDLMRFLTPHFKNVRVFETVYPSRHNLYFYASDNAVLPFDGNWASQIVSNSAN
ncbi:MAG TPA: class I SAM-dependent methyltransferase [Burkholderiaceae bacterium]|nr:class I SAM-dependent methyltransferase [Burkholderiaceae bacterium]